MVEGGVEGARHEGPLLVGGAAREELGAQRCRQRLMDVRERSRDARRAVGEHGIGPIESLVVIDGFFNIVNWRNTGAAWGIFQDRNFLLALVSLATVLVLYLLRHSFQLDRKACRIALGLIGGGIIGNLVDRLRVGSVIDFLDFHINGYHWPAFNVADAAITVGVVALLLDAFVRPEAAKSDREPVIRK